MWTLFTDHKNVSNNCIMTININTLPIFLDDISHEPRRLGSTFTRFPINDVSCCGCIVISKSLYPTTLIHGGKKNLHYFNFRCTCV